MDTKDSLNGDNMLEGVEDDMESGIENQPEAQVAGEESGINDDDTPNGDYDSGEADADSEAEQVALKDSGKIAVIRKTKKKVDEKKKINFAKLNINELANMTISGLSALAREFKIEGTSRMKKQDLIPAGANREARSNFRLGCT